MAIKCVLYDADWVIINTEYFSVQYQRDFGIPNEKMLPFFTWDFQECLVWKLDLKEAIKPHLKDWGWEWSIDELLDYRFKSEHSIDQRIVDDINGLKWKWIKVCLATKQEQYRTNYIKKEMWFVKIFDEIYSSADIKHKKPDPKFFDYICDDLSKIWIKKDEILFIDDEEKNINSAIEVWIHAHHYKWYNENYKNVITPLLHDDL